MATSHYSAEESPKDARMPGMEVGFFSIHPSSLFLLLQFFLRRPLLEIPRLRGKGRAFGNTCAKKSWGVKNLGVFFFARTLWIFFVS